MQENVQLKCQSYCFNFGASILNNFCPFWNFLICNFRLQCISLLSSWALYACAITLINLARHRTLPLLLFHCRFRLGYRNLRRPCRSAGNLCWVSSTPLLAHYGCDTCTKIQPSAICNHASSSRGQCLRKRWFLWPLSLLLFLHYF